MNCALRLLIVREGFGASRARFAAPCSVGCALDQPCALPSSAIGGVLITDGHISIFAASSELEHPGRYDAEASRKT